MKLAIYGGTFDPIHHGHLIIAREALETLGPDEVIFVPARVSPFKKTTPVASGEIRLSMLRAAIENEIGFAVDEASLRLQRDHLTLRGQIQTRCPALFLNFVGNRLSTQGITNVISELRKDAKIERHVTPHMLRHTVATLLLRNGVDIRVVQEFLGHSSIATTQRYTHISKEHLISVLKTSHPSFNLRSNIWLRQGEATDRLDRYSQKC